MEIIETETYPDLIQILIRILPRYSVSQSMGYLKGKSSLMKFGWHTNLKHKHADKHKRVLRRYRAGKKKPMQRYIRNQLEEDRVPDQISIKEFIALLSVARISRRKETFHR